MGSQQPLLGEVLQPRSSLFLQHSCGPLDLALSGRQGTVCGIGGGAFDVGGGLVSSCYRVGEVGDLAGGLRIRDLAQVVLGAPVFLGSTGGATVVSIFTGPAAGRAPDRLQHYPPRVCRATADSGEQPVFFDRRRRWARVRPARNGFVAEHTVAQIAEIGDKAGSLAFGNGPTPVFLIPTRVEDGVFHFHPVGDLQSVRCRVIFQPLLHDGINPVHNPPLGPLLVLPPGQRDSVFLDRSPAVRSIDHPLHDPFIGPANLPVVEMDVPLGAAFLLDADNSAGVHDERNLGSLNDIGGHTFQLGVPAVVVLCVLEYQFGPVVPFDFRHPEVVTLLVFESTPLVVYGLFHFFRRARNTSRTLEEAAADPLPQRHRQ